MTKRIIFVMVFAIVVSLFAGVTCASAVDQPTIRKGSKGKAVGIAQHMLNVVAEAGYFELDEPLAEDNDFGSATKRSVIAFQHAFDLDADGVIGKKTWAALYEIYDAVTAAQEDEALSVSVKNLNIPDHMYQYEVFKLEGTLRGSDDLGTVYVGIYDLAGGKINVAMFTSVGEKLSLSKVNEKITLSDTKPGDYYFMILVDDGSGLTEVVVEELEIRDWYVDSSSFEDTENTILCIPRSKNKTKISEHFKVSEFACSCGKCDLLISRRLVAGLEELRAELGGSAITISSGFRCPSYNAKIPNAASRSKHTLGLAANIKVSGHSSLEVAQAAERLGFNGIGWYNTSSGGRFTHVDVRDGVSFWREHAQYYVSSFLSLS